MTLPVSSVRSGRLCAFLLASMATFVQPLWADGDKEVITAEEIERQKPASLLELLNRRVGLGSSSNVLSLRGVPGVALYVDGFSRGNSTAEIEKIKPQDVARIEILRGAASSRYGAEALGGAVVITTGQGAGHWSLDGVQGYNSLDSRYSRVIGNGGFGPAGIRLSFEDSYTRKSLVVDRLNNPYPSIAQTQAAYETKREGDFRANYRNGWFSTAVNVDYIEQYRNFGRPNRNNAYSTLRTRWQTEAVFDQLKLNANILYEDNRLDVFRDAGEAGAAGLALYMKGPENSSTLSSEFQANYGNLNVGVLHGNDWEFVEQRLADNGRVQFRQKDLIDRLGIFGSYGWDFLPDWRLDLAGRFDRYEYSKVTVFADDRLSHEPDTQFDTFNPKLGLSWKASSWLGLHGSVSTGFVPPYPSTLYFRRDTPGSRYVPNRGLKPEESLTVDFGANVDYGNGGNLGVTAFFTRWTDKLTLVSTVEYSASGSVAVDTIKNVGESESKGIEISVSQPVTEALNASLNYTFNYTEITSYPEAAYIGNRLPFQPLHRLNAVLDYRPPWKGNVRINLHYESEQFINLDNIVRQYGAVWRNRDFTAVDFLVSRQLKWSDRGGIDLTFGINNLFDSRYAKNYFERDPGRVFRGELAVHF